MIGFDLSWVLFFLNSESSAKMASYWIQSTSRMCSHRFEARQNVERDPQSLCNRIRTRIKIIWCNIKGGNINNKVQCPPQ